MFSLLNEQFFARFIEWAKKLHGVGIFTFGMYHLLHFASGAEHIILPEGANIFHLPLSSININPPPTNSIVLYGRMLCHYPIAQTLPHFAAH